MNRRALLSGGLGLAGLALMPRMVWAGSLFDGKKLDPGAPRRVVPADGLNFRKIIQMGDTMSFSGQGFGSSNAFTASFPADNDRLLLWVNHESPASLLSDQGGWSYLGREATIGDVLDSMGASVLELQRNAEGGWDLVADSQKAWRLTGRTPDILATGPASTLIGKSITGTLQNGGGGVTPWSTVMSCEGRFYENVPEGPGCHDGKVGTEGEVTGDRAVGYPGEHFGWILEADPKDITFTPRKHTAMGRLRHGSCNVVLRKGKPMEVFLTDKRPCGGFWRYTSTHNWEEGMKRNQASGLLTYGALAIARFEEGGRGKWLTLEPDAHIDKSVRDAILLRSQNWKLSAEYKKKLKAAKKLSDIYDSEAALLVDAWLAGMLIGGSALGTPSSSTSLGSAIYLSLQTASGISEGDPLRPPVDEADGCIIRLESNDKGFNWLTSVVGGADMGAPDQLTRDAEDILLICTNATDDRSSSSGWGNNSLMRLTPTGAVRVVIGPPGAAVTGPSLTEDGETLFLSLQHPSRDWGRSAVICVFSEKKKKD